MNNTIKSQEFLSTNLFVIPSRAFLHYIFLPTFNIEAIVFIQTHGFIIINNLLICSSLKDCCATKGK